MTSRSLAIPPTRPAQQITPIARERKAVRPSEMAAMVRPHGLALSEAMGVIYSPLADSWRLSTSDLDVNYMLKFERNEPAA